MVEVNKRTCTNKCTVIDMVGPAQTTSLAGGFGHPKAQTPTPNPYFRVEKLVLGAAERFESGAAGIAVGVRPF